MKRLATDFLILLMIAAPVAALALLMPQDNLRIERNWGSVMYSPPVSSDEANALADVLVQQGLFVGNPIAFKLSRNADVWVLMMASGRNYEDVIDRETMTEIGVGLCAAALPGKTVSFVLMDEDMEPFDELIPPRLFAEPQQN